MIKLFTIEFIQETRTGWALAGSAPQPDTRLPGSGEIVEVRNPGGSAFEIRLLNVDEIFGTRNCFVEKTVNRAVFVESYSSINIQPGAEIWGKEEAEMK